MSLRYEQYWALLRGRKYIHDKFVFWCAVRGRLRYIKPLKKWAQGHVDDAYRCLRHWPMQDERGKPRFSSDEITDSMEVNIDVDKT